jgi:hypothetical protein
MEDFLGFIFFSTFEGITVLSLAFYIFRLDFVRYLLPSLAVIFVINLQNYFIREELSISWIAPVINLVITALYFATYIRIPLLWSLVLAISGYIGLGLVQTGIVNLSFGYLSLAESSDNIWKMYMVQTLSGFIGFAIGFLIYKFGYGFTFDFEHWRLSKEKLIVSSLIIVFIILLGVMMYYRDIYLNLLVFVLALVIFLLYTFKKEDAEG